MLQDEQLVYTPLRIGYDEDVEASNLSPPLPAAAANLSLIPATTSNLQPPSSYLDRLLASTNSLLGRRKKRNAFQSSLEDFDQLEGELAQIALTFIGQMPFVWSSLCDHAPLSLRQPLFRLSLSPRNIVATFT